MLVLILLATATTIVVDDNDVVVIAILLQLDYRHCWWRSFCCFYVVTNRNRCNNQTGRRNEEKKKNKNELKLKRSKIKREMIFNGFCCSMCCVRAYSIHSEAAIVSDWWMDFGLPIMQINFNGHILCVYVRWLLAFRRRREAHPMCRLKNQYFHEYTSVITIYSQMYNLITVWFHDE